MSNDTPHDLVQSQPASHVNYTAIGGGRNPMNYEVRIERTNVGIHITKREGRVPNVEIDGDPAYTRQALNSVIDMLVNVRDKIAPEAPKPAPCVGLEPGYPWLAGSRNLVDTSPDAPQPIQPFDCGVGDARPVSLGG